MISADLGGRTLAAFRSLPLGLEALRDVLSGCTRAITGSPVATVRRPQACKEPWGPILWQGRVPPRLAVVARNLGHHASAG